MKISDNLSEQEIESLLENFYKYFLIQIMN